MENNNNEQNETTYVHNDEGTTIKTDTNINTNTINQENKDEKGFSIAALIFGIVAILLSCIWYVSLISGILAIILGILGIKSSKRGLSIAGIITGVIGIILMVIIYVAVIILGLTILNNLGNNIYNNLDDFEDYGNNFEDQLNDVLEDYGEKFEINYNNNNIL